MKENKSLVKSTTIYAMGDIIPKLLSLVSFPILTTYLTPADYGIVNYSATLNTFLMVFGLLGVNTYYLVHYYKCEDEIAKKKMLGNLVTFIFGFNILLIILAFLFGILFYDHIGSNIPFFPYIAITLVIYFFNIFSIFPSALYRLLEKPMLLSVINIIKSILTLVITLILVVYFKYDVLGVLYSSLFVNILFSVVFSYTIRDQFIWNIDLNQIKKALIFSLPLVPGSLAYYVTTISDRFLIDKYLTLEDLGIYSTSATLALILNIISYGAYKAFEPYIFKNWGTEDFNKKFKDIRNGFAYVLLVGVLLLSVFAKEFYQIMANEKFHVAYKYVPLIIIGVFSASMTMLYGTIITAKGKTKVNALINFIGAIISLVLNIWLLPKLGLIVAACVSSFAMTVMFCISVKYANLKVSEIRFLLAIGLVAVVVYFSVYVFVIDQIILSILIKGVISLLTILGLSVILSINPINIFKR